MESTTNHLMSWNELLKPNLILGDTVLQIGPETIEKYGLRGMVLDVDETLLPIHASEVSAELKAWIDRMRPLVPLWLVSNNISSRRIGRIAESLQLPYIAGAAKPSRGKLWQAVAAMKLPAGKVAMVGDRLFTDVLAGNRLGMFTILVEPIVSPVSPRRSFRLRSVEIWLSKILGVRFDKWK